MDRRKFVLSTGVVGISSLAGCSEIEQLTGPSEEEVKEEAESPSWDEIFRNIDEWEGEPVHYSSIRLLNSIDEDGEFAFIIRHPDNDGFGSDAYLYCRWDGNPFQDQDIVNIWGVVQGIHTYTSLGGERSVPEIDLVDIELVD